MLVNQNEIDECAAANNIDAIALRSQTLLHLPRLLTDPSVSDPETYRNEMWKLAAQLHTRTRQHAHFMEPPDNKVELENLEFIELDVKTAIIFHENFHYIGSYRPGYHYAYVDKISNKIVCIGSIASCDLQHVLDKIKEHVTPKEAMVLSRFFAFRWAPENTFSHFVKRLQKWLVFGFDVKLLFTFINPNLTFNGGSHIGAGFKPFATEEGTNYMYFNGRYVTMRQLVKIMGTSDPIQLRAKLGSSFIVANSLAPMEIMAKSFNRRATQVIPDTPYVFQRPVITES